MTLATGTREPLIGDLQSYRQAFSRAKEEASGIAGGLSDAQFNWRPEPGRWSVAECLDHLRVTGEEVLRYLEPAVERAVERRRFAAGPFRYGWLSRKFVEGTGPEVKPGGPKSPRVYRPTPAQPKERVIPAFVALQDRLAAAAERANGLDLARIRVRSPVTPLLRLPLGAWFASLAGHQERHLRQARRVMEHPGFPRA